MAGLVGSVRWEAIEMGSRGGRPRWVWVVGDGGAVAMGGWKGWRWWEAAAAATAALVGRSFEIWGKSFLK
jgi:hypothetical protein